MYTTQFRATPEQMYFDILTNPTDIELQLSFAEYNLFYRSLLQTRPIIFVDPTNRSHPIAHPGVHPTQILLQDALWGGYG